MLSTKSLFKTLVVALPLFVLMGATSASAIEIKDTNVEIKNDFVLEPAKIEINLKPGEKATKTLSVVNRTDKDLVFNVTVEDFTGSRDLNQVVKLLGTDRSPYSLKDLIKPEVNTFKLGSKQRALIPVTINIPADTEPGGKYASVLVSTLSASDSNNTSDNQAKTISRIGALYFIRVAGPVKEDGKLTDFRLTGPSKPFYEKGPFNFEMLFENNGSVHLTPSGHVDIKNTFGQKVQSIDVPAFFSLPDSLRSAQAKWDPSVAFGHYTATVTLDRSYQTNPDSTDTMSISFWVLPWKILVGFIIAVILVILVIRAIVKNFEIRKK